MKTTADGCEDNRFMNSPGVFERGPVTNGRCPKFGECEWIAEVVVVIYMGGVCEGHNG